MRKGGSSSAARASSRFCTSVSKSIRSEEHTSELQSRLDIHSFPTRRSSDLKFETGNVRASDYAKGRFFLRSTRKFPFLYLRFEVYNVQSCVCNWVSLPCGRE